MNVMIAYVVCALVWGTTWFAIRVCIGDGGYPTFAAAALRFTLAALILLPVLFTKLARPGPRTSRQWAWLIAAGLLNAVGYSLVYIGEESVPGGLAAVLFGTEPLAIALLVTITRTERVSRAELVGALVAMMGIGVIFLDRVDVSTSQAVGIVLILGAVVVSGVYSMIMKKHADDVHPLASAAVFLTSTAVALWVAAVAAGWETVPWPPPVKPTVALMYLGVFGSVVAFVMFFYLLKRVSLMTISTLVFLMPIIALSVDAIWEDDVRLAARTYLGIAITLGGVAYSFVFRPKATTEVRIHEPHGLPEIDLHASSIAIALDSE